MQNGDYGIMDRTNEIEKEFGEEDSYYYAKDVSERQNTS